MGFIIAAAGSALNWALFVRDPNPWSLFAGIFCGALALGILAMDLS